jgi:hypothetical protein
MCIYYTEPVEAPDYDISISETGFFKPELVKTFQMSSDCSVETKPFHKCSPLEVARIESTALR